MTFVDSGTLDREEAPVLVVHQVEGPFGLLLLQHPEYPRGIGGVRHHEEALLAEAVHDEVFDHAATFVQHEVVEGIAHPGSGEVVGDEPLQHPEGPRTDHLDLPEVREIEQPHMVTDAPVLRECTLVLDRHLPPGEGGELGAQSTVLRLERCSLELFGRLRPVAPRHPADRTARRCEAVGTWGGMVPTSPRIA